MTGRKVIRLYRATKALQSSAKPSKERLETTPMKVMLADDHDLVRDAIGALLRLDEPDLDLTTVKDLHEALAETRSQSDFDAVC